MLSLIHISDTQTAAGGDNVTIKFTWWGNQTRHDYTQQILDKYTELHQIGRAHV